MKKGIKIFLCIAFFPFIILYFGVKDLVNFFKLNKDYKNGESNVTGKKYLYRGSSLVFVFIIMMAIGAFSKNNPTDSSSRTTVSNIKETKSSSTEDKKVEEKKAKFEGYTYEEEQRMLQMVSDNIKAPEGSEQTKLELFNNSGLKSAKVVYTFEDSNGLIHNYDHFIIIDENWEITENNYREKFGIGTSLEILIKANCKDMIESTLKAPSTAKYPGMFDDGWKYGINDDGTIITIQTWVDSQNSFGAMIRTNYQFQLDMQTMVIRCTNTW